MSTSHTMKMQLVDLPNEILCQILDRLSNTDVHTLHAIPVIKQRIKNHVCLVRDNQPHRSSFPFLSNVISFEDKDWFEKSRKWHRIVVEVHKFSSTGNALYQALDGYRGLNIHVSFFGQNISSFDLSVWREALSPSERRIKTLTIEEADNFTIPSGTIHQDGLFAPNAKNLTIVPLCFEKSLRNDRVATTWELPMLEELIVYECFRFKNCLDISKVRRLRLQGKTDLRKLEELKLPFLTELDIYNIFQPIRFGTMQRNEIERLALENVDTETFGRLPISNFPKLTNLKLCSKLQGVSLLGLTLSNLTHLSVRCPRVDHVIGIELPMLQVVSFVVTEPAPKSLVGNFEFLSRVKEFQVIIENRHLVKYLRDVQKLTAMLVNNFPEEEYDLPDLTYIEASPRCNLQPFKSSKIKSMLFSYHSVRGPTSLRTVQSMFGNSLRDLEIRYFEDKEFSYFEFPSLESLKVTAKPFFKGVISCNFPKLTSLTFKHDCRRSAHNVTQTQWCFNAPNLEELAIIGYLIEELDVTGFPALESITVDGVKNVKKITSKEYKRARINEVPRVFK